ncbi:MAG: DUF433 domain-containing protein [Melioribacteraceae bacterium]
METRTSYKYIVKKTGNNEPTIEGTRISVRDIVEQWKLGSSPEEIISVYPHINLSRVFEALAYYQDNMSEVEHFININKVPENLSGKALS